MPPATTVVYDNTSLIAWKGELRRISEISGSLEDKRVYLKRYQDELGVIDSEISSIRSQLASPQERISHRNPPHYRSPEALAEKKATRDSLQSELARLEGERGWVLNQIQGSARSISAIEIALSESRSSQAWYEEHVPACENFLRTLQEEPAKLVSDLYDKLVKAFAAYEDNHLVKRSPQVRISLLVVRYQLLNLFENHASFAPEHANQIHQRNYLRLCGFIWNMYYRVEQENKDNEFENLLGTFVRSTHVMLDGDLPDHLRTGWRVSSWFEDNRRRLPSTFAMQEWELPGIEEHVLGNEIAVNMPGSYYSSRSPLQSHVMNAISLIDAEIKMKKQKQEEIDYHFYISAVRVLNGVFANPADQLAAKRIADIAEYASGSSSVGKKVLGGLVIVLGVLLIAASVAGFAATFGSSSLLSAWGIALGLSFMQAKITFAAVSSVVAATGMGLTFFAGPSLIKSGQQQGLSRELMSVKEGVENYEAPPPVTAPPMDDPMFMYPPAYVAP